MAVTQVTYNTHDVQLLLEPVDCRMTQLVFSSVAHCIASADKLEVMAGESSVSYVFYLLRHQIGLAIGAVF